MNTKTVNYIITGVVGVLFNVFMPINGGSPEITLLPNLGRQHIKNDISQQVHLTIYERVQGVFFHRYAQRKAIELGLTGWVRDTDNGQIEILAQGEENTLNQFIGWFKKELSHERAAKMKIEWQSILKSFNDFSVVIN